MAAPTVNIHGLKEDMLLGAGPVLPAAWTTNIPAFIAESKDISIGLKNVANPDGRLLGVIDKLIISTPSSAACKQNSLVAAECKIVCSMRFI